MVGGPQTVYEHSLFEIGWWGEGQDKAYAYINAHAPQGATWNLVGVVHHTTDALREDLRFRAHLPDYVIAAYLSPAEQHRTGYTAVFSIEVASAPIVVVYQRDDLLGEETPHE